MVVHPSTVQALVGLKEGDTELFEDRFLAEDYLKNLRHFQVCL
jgi:hypothetical protein